MRITDLTPLARGGGAGAPSNQTRPLTARGEVAVAPRSEGDVMQVTVRTVTRQFGVEIPAGNWEPRGAALPTVGAECLVVFDDLGDAFVPVWAGASDIKLDGWLGLNSNSVAGYGPLDFWPPFGVVWDRQEFVQPASAPLANIATAVANGMRVCVLIEEQNYNKGNPFPTDSASIAAFASYWVSAVQTIEATHPAAGFVYEIINEPWNFYSPGATAAEYADLVVVVLQAAQAANLDLKRIYPMARNAQWVTDMYAQQPTLKTLCQGWCFHPYGPPPPGSFTGDGAGIVAVANMRPAIASGADNILLSEIGVWAPDVNGGAGGSIGQSASALNSDQAAQWMTRTLEVAAQYHAEGWLKALILYSRNDGGWATNLLGGSLTESGKALQAFPAPVDGIAGAAARPGLGLWRPADDGLRSVTFDPVEARDTLQPNLATVYLARLTHDQAGWSSYLAFWLTALGSGLTAGQNFVGIYNQWGQLYNSSSDMTAKWESPGGSVGDLFESSMGGNYISGYLYAAILVNGTTAPTFAASASSPVTNIGRFESTPSRFMRTTGTYTTLPSTLNFSTDVVTDDHGAFFGLTDG